MTVITYEIRPGRAAPCELWSVATGLKHGRNAKNYVCEGTHTYCQAVKEKLEKLEKMK